MSSYNRKRAAIELKENPLLGDLLAELKQDVIDAFPAAMADELPGLQLEYRLVEELATKLDNEIHREAGE